MNLALIYFNTNQAPKAYDSMKRAISLSPNEPGLYLQLAQMYEAAGDTDSAQMVRSQMPISTN
jgi:Tfp pilus assembly protein PilF